MEIGIVFKSTLFLMVVFNSAADKKALGQTLCNPLTRFMCHDGVCISKAKVCDKNPDCPGGEDEENCPESAPESCYTRNDTMARANGYICRRACDPSEGCRARNKKCICDDECGYSCINKWATCSGRLPLVANSTGFEMRQRLGTPASEWYYYFGATIRYICPAGMQLKGPMPRCTGRKIWSAEVPQCVDVICKAAVPNVTNTVSSRFLRPTGNNFIPVRDDELPTVNDIIEYRCGSGMLRLGNPPTCGEDLQWTPHSIRCVVTCFEQRNSDLITSQNLTCGRDCDTSADCSTEKECHCDGLCGRVCVDPDADCGQAQEIAHTSLNYTGSGVKKIARYSCDDGYYLRFGSLSIYCSVTGIWVGDAPVCGAIFCGDPGLSIRATGGFIYSYGGLHFGSIVEFKCRHSHRLLGSKTRTCMGDGKWSGQLAVCDRRDNFVRCPNPGVPINGNTVRVSRENFAINSTISFQCDSGYILVGDEVQTCLWFKQWSGHSTPLCIDPRYPQSAPDAIGTLSRSLANLPTREATLGRSLLSHETDRTHEVYFLFDVSESVLKRHRDLLEEIHFAKRFVRRMEEFGGTIKYGIMVFASENLTAIDITDERVRTTDDVLDALDQIYTKAPNKTYKGTTRSGTATGEVLDRLEETIAFMNGRNKIRNPNGKKTKRHVFIFTDGKHTEGRDPVKKRETMEKQFRPNIEFYSITACKGCHENDISELTGLASLNEKGKKNYIYIDDFYQLSTYLDQVTDLKYDFSKCGEAGDVGSIKTQASLGRAAGGEDAAENAWPWQVFVEGKSRSTRKDVAGGGSILNQNWILSAAHVLKGGWEFKVTAGMFERTSDGESVSTSVQMCQAEQTYIHPDYNDQNFHNDIGLIKLGSRIDPVTSSPIKNVAPGLTYTYYVRPVCLPCTGSCLQRSQLTDNDERLNLESMTNEEICREEEKLLIDPNAKTVVTGFGHYKKTNDLNYEAEGATRLQQALLQIADDETCRDGISEINIRMELEKNKTYSFSKKTMFCCQSWSSDACQGDSGGPVVREVVDSKSESCWIQIGIVSFGYGCQIGDIPGFYTNVARYIPWLREIAGNETVPNP